MQKDPVSRILESGYDIPTVQRFLAHACLQTTMIYTHVARKADGIGVKSPLDV